MAARGACPWDDLSFSLCRRAVQVILYGDSESEKKLFPQSSSVCRNKAKKSNFVHPSSSPFPAQLSCSKIMGLNPPPPFPVVPDSNPLQFVSATRNPPLKPASTVHWPRPLPPESEKRKEHVDLFDFFFVLCTAYDALLLCAVYRFLRRFLDSRKM